MKKYILLLFLCVSIQTIYAHNPLSALFYLEANDQMSILTISLSQTGLNEALIQQNSDFKLEELSSTEYKELAVKYVKENFDLHINGKKVQLLEGGIKLGNHETGMKFITSELPHTFESLNIHIKAFSENEQHQSIFSLLLNGNTSKVILNQGNNYAAEVIFKDDIMVVNSTSFNKNYFWFLLIIPIFIVGKRLMRRTN